MTIPVVNETYHAQCVMFVCNRCLSYRYLVSLYVAHEHGTLCMICFLYYWYCHVVSPFGIWYHHMLHMNTTH
jgi:hypothetical protein